MESYKGLALVYDKLMKEEVSYNNWFNYIQQIFHRYNTIPMKVLEMACGTGNLTEYLCQYGYSVSCFDISEDMLSIAYDKLSRYRNIRIFNQNMINFKLNEVFDAVICICDGINYLVDEDDLLRVFINVYNHLNNSGIFVFDISSYYKLKNIIGNNTFVEDSEDVFYVWENFFDEDKDICEFYLTFFIKEKDKYIRFDEKHMQKAHNVENVVKNLKKAGFKSIDVYDAFTFDEPSKESERINFIAIK